MTPSAKALKEALIQGTCDVFKLEPDTTSVNKVRHHVEEELGLDPDFFSGPDWKQKSKEIIKEYVGKLLEGWEPSAMTNGTKPSNGGASKNQRSTTAKGNSKGVVSQDDAADSPVRDSPSSDRKRKRKTDNESNDDKGEDEGVDPDDKDAKLESKSPDPLTADVEEEEEYSDVIDEPPTSKRKKTKKEPGPKTTTAKASSSSKTKPQRKKKKSSAAEPSDPHEAEVKKLQSQLTKCGMRKLWHNELKGCDSARSRIQHLKKMLADVGMQGRFSEAKAREIKETRELLADAEAAQEMNRLWGFDSGGRNSHSRDDDDDDDDNDGDAKSKDGNGNKDSLLQNGHDDDDDDVSFAARRRRAHADLAFLGDDSDSD